MYARKLFAGVATTAVALATVALTGAPAYAAYTQDPDDSVTSPSTTDFIGVGSDTSQHALKLLADAWNSKDPAPSYKIATFAATGGGTLPVAGDPNRPNGSGAGKSTLYGSGNNPEFDFARSSSAQSTAETNAGLQSFPFMLDTLVMVVSQTVASNAPTSLTPAQIVAIYKGEITNWSQVGGTPGAIAPKTPQPGSGTRSFWDAQLRAMNGGVAVTYAATVQEVQEHEDDQVKDNPNAIAPFSKGRAELLGNTVRVQNGWSADRAIYNVVRGTDVNNPRVVELFGSNGFFCSPQAKPLIEQAGFKQLFTPSRGGACGAPTQSATSNFTVAEVPTTTTVAVTSASASSARIVATVTGSTSPSGTVSFFEGPTLLQGNVPLVSGSATRIQPASPGTHTYRAVFTPAASTPFLASEGQGTGTVQKASSSISESFPSKVKSGKKAKGTVNVTLSGSSAKASGVITISEGGKTLVTQTLSGGSTSVTLPKLKKGKHTLVISWGGDANGNGSTLTFKIKVQKKKK